MENLYKQYFEEMPAYLSILDRDLKIIGANRLFRKDFGDFEGRYCFEMNQKQQGKCEHCPAKLSFHDGKKHGIEEEFTNLSGRRVSLIVYTTPIRNEKGEIIAILKMATDISEIKILQNQVHEGRQRYLQLFEESPCYISIQNRNLQIIEANRHFREDFGEPGRRKCYEVYKHRQEECVSCPVQQTFQDGKVHQSEEVVISRNGTPVNVVVYTAPIRGTDGQIQNVMEMSTNITQIRLLQSQLTDLGLVIGSISHGIKGLLTSLDGGIYLVNSGLEKNNPDRLQQGWQMVKRNMSRIRSMVLDLLYYAKDREPDWADISAPSLGEEVLSLMHSKAKEYGIEMVDDLKRDAGSFEGDPKAIRSLLINLMENSLDACRVDKRKNAHQVQFGLAGDSESVRFEIQDNGIGMDQEAREKAFTLFFSSKKGNGTGLGLFISNKIVRAHGGEITIESELHRGTRMIVKLPRRRQNLNLSTSQGLSRREP